MTSRQVSNSILPIDDMPDYTRMNGISSAIIEVPGLAAHHTLEGRIIVHPKTRNQPL